MTTTRRTFLGAASVGTAAWTVAGPARAAASRRVVLGMIGPGGMGTNHLKQLCTRRDVTVAYVCDVDETRLAAAAKLVDSATGKPPKAVKDLRRVLVERRSWLFHALATSTSPISPSSRSRTSAGCWTPSPALNDCSCMAPVVKSASCRPGPCARRPKRRRAFPHGSC